MSRRWAGAKACALSDKETTSVFCTLTKKMRRRTAGIFNLAGRARHGARLSYASLPSYLLVEEGREHHMKRKRA